LRHEVVEIKPVKQVTANVTWTSYYVNQPVAKAEEEDEAVNSDPGFRVLIHPSELLQIELIWNVVMNSLNPEVVEKSVDFLIKIYMSLEEGLSDDRSKIT